MRIISAMTRTEALVSGTLDQERQAQRERQAAQVAHAIISTKDELPRNELEFGKRFIEHTPTGRFFWLFSGDPGYTGSDVNDYYVRQDGVPVLLQQADPPSRDALEKRQAAKEQRRLERDAEAKRRRAEMRALAP